MVFLSLVKQTFREINMIFDVQENTQLEVESSFSFSVHYKQDNSECVAKLRQEIVLKSNPDKFRITVESFGTFVCEGIENADDKRQAHAQSYVLLFPYVQNMIAQLSVHAGLPPLTIQMAHMSPENVNFEGSTN